eukprot:gb/GEZN01012310.1/.p1 GENE.gb/GEZN01012310.1/~~gb/GEZN01012310.1/.p1  ORF type:complete len:217 (+),score=59.08 gb/GEZN01012310.1/:79-729(+)
MAVLLASLLLGLVSAGKGVFEGTDANFNSDVLGSGKNVFVKFFAPWCGHCKGMKPDWDKLGAKYANSDSVMIVDVDCTASGQGTCGKEGVKGYPTIKYYMAGSKKSKDYQGGRDLASLTTFAENTLNKAMCDPLTGKGCKPIEQKFIDENKGKSKSELEELIKTRAETFKELKKEHAAAAKEWKAKEAQFKKSEKKHQMAEKILKALAKSAKKDEL